MGTKTNAINRQGSLLISLLLVLAIIGFIYWVMTRTARQNAPDGTMMKDAGIDTSSYKSIIDSAKKVA
ncbi:MAG TPA: hypothetical protein VI749_02480, partial [Candidatus Omnitrophota bacterium]|nr:hypothetical protein [Candidatus Omnitrophota bacterium]